MISVFLKNGKNIIDDAYVFEWHFMQSKYNYTIIMRFPYASYSLYVTMIPSTTTKKNNFHFIPMFAFIFFSSSTHFNVSRILRVCAVLRFVHFCFLDNIFCSLLLLFMVQCLHSLTKLPNFIFENDMLNKTKRARGERRLLLYCHQNGYDDEDGKKKKKFDKSRVYIKRKTEKKTIKTKSRTKTVNEILLSRRCQKIFPKQMRKKR